MYLSEIQRGRLLLKCDWCGVEFTRRKSYRWNTGNDFCGRVCQSQWHSKQMREGYNHQRGKPHAEGTKAKIAEAHRGKTFSLEVNKKKGRSGPSNKFFGRKHSEETRKIISIKAKKRFSDVLERLKDSDNAKARWADTKYREEHLKYSFAALNMRPNKLEQVVDTMLRSYFPNEWKYCGDGSVTIGGFSPDFINVNGKKLLIEVFGNYWHVDAPDTPSYRREKPRKAIFRKYGFRTLVLWEKNIRSKAPECIAKEVEAFVAKE